MKTLFLLVVAAMLATTATAQREVIKHERFTFTSSPVLTADHDSLFVVLFEGITITGSWYDVSSDTLIGSWTHIEQASRVYTEPDLGLVFVENLSGSLTIIDAVTGKIVNLFTGVVNHHRIPSTDILFVWQWHGSIIQLSLTDPLDVTTIIQNGLSEGDQYEFELNSFNGYPRFVSTLRKNADFVLIDRKRKRIDRYFDLAGTSGIEGFESGGDTIVVRNAVTDDRLYALLPSDETSIESVVLSHDGDWLLWIGRSFSNNTTSLHAVDLANGSSLDPIEISSHSRRILRVNNSDGWMQVEMDDSHSTYFRFDPATIISQSVAIDDLQYRVFSDVGGRSLVKVTSERAWARISSLKGELILERGELLNTTPFTYLAKGRYLVRGKDSVIDNYSHIDLFDVATSPIQKTRTISLKNLSLPKLQRYESQQTLVRILDALTDTPIIETDLPAPYRVNGDFEKIFEPLGMIADSLGVVFYRVNTYDRLWTQRPGERSFSLLWNGGLFQELVFPGGAEHAYVVMYNNRVGRFSRIDGSFKGYMDERTPLHTISSIAVDPTTNGLILSTPSGLVFWDPILHMITDSIPFPAGVRGSWRVAHASKDHSRVVITESTSNGRVRAILLSDGGYEELPTYTQKTRFMSDGLITISVSANNTVRVSSTLGDEEIDMGQGTSTHFQLFNNDSSIVFMGQDSTIILRYPFHNTITKRDDSDASVRNGTAFKFAPNIIVNSEDPYSVAISGVVSGVPCIISMSGLRGQQVRCAQVVPTSDLLDTSLSLNGLDAGMYTVSVTQADRMLMRQCVMVSP